MVVEIEWQREWFPKIARYPKEHWNSTKNCREFLDNIAAHYNVQTPKDWKKISLHLIDNKGGRVAI